MSDEPNKEGTDAPESTPPVAGFPLLDPSITDIAANLSYIVINDSDVIIYFGLQIDAPPQNPIKPSVRIALSHGSFLRMMQVWNTRAEFLKYMYDNRFPALSGADPSRFEEAIKFFTDGEKPRHTDENPSNSND